MYACALCSEYKVDLNDGMHLHSRCSLSSHWSWFSKVVSIWCFVPWTSSKWTNVSLLPFFFKSLLKVKFLLNFFLKYTLPPRINHVHVLKCQVIIDWKIQVFSNIFYSLILAKVSFIQIQSSIIDKILEKLKNSNQLEKWLKKISLFKIFFLKNNPINH